MSDLASRMAALKTDSRQFTLSDFLYIYHQAKKECYIEYMHGARELYKFLSDGKGLDLETSSYPHISDPDYPISILNTWETAQLGKILSSEGKEDHVYSVKDNFHTRAVLVTMVESVIPAIYSKREAR